MTTAAVPNVIAVAARARTAASVTRDTWGAPETMGVLRFIASHFDAAASLLDTYDGSNPWQLDGARHALLDARELIVTHQDVRLPDTILQYVSAPLTGLPLPVLPRLLPVNAQHAADEGRLRAEIDRLHADTAAADNTPDTWLRAVLTTLTKWERIAAAVDVDNKRPCHREQVAALHLKCIACGGSNIRFAVREWAVCACGKGQLWGEAQTCDCWGYECPAIQANRA
ncbi:hypothetical protein [Streptomyces sp. BH055]|uniref:hypothetical protein n=1 Tax=unclassified Streptomyces TaxID=2593676 RepID=UPI003BB6257A